MHPIEPDLVEINITILNSYLLTPVSYLLAPCSLLLTPYSLLLTPCSLLSRNKCIAFGGISASLRLAPYLPNQRNVSRYKDRFSIYGL